VVKGTYNGSQVAIKKIKGRFTEKEMSEFLKEGELTRSIPHHPNVIKCLGICLMPLCIGTLKYFFLSNLLVLEFCEGGSLFTKLQKNEFNIKQKMSIIEGIAKGMAHLRLYSTFYY
jgi:serine/threonine protein kinase